MRIGHFLRVTRESAGLTQRALSGLTGVSQGTVAAYERELRSPRLDLVERLLDAMGLQLAFGAEPRDADVDAAIDAAAGQSLEERCADWPIQKYLALLEMLHETEPVIEGSLAAALLGTPVPVGRLDLAIVDDDAIVNAFIRWANRCAYRWIERTQRYGMVDPDPRDGRSLDYECVFGRLRLRLAPGAPEHVLLQVDGKPLRVRTLAGVLVEDAESARALDRMRARLASAP